jgi:glycosyltransferase involved in cell wall biosynthesis
MPSRERPPSAAHPRPFCHAGLLWDDFDPDSAWLRETAVLHFRKPADPAQFTLVGRRRAHPELRGLERGQPGLRVRVNGKLAAELPPGEPGDWSLPLALPAGEEIELTLELTGNSLTNALAWAGRVTGLPAGQRFRAQRRNRQLRLLALRAADGAAVCDFGRPDAVFAAAYVRGQVRLGLNIVGFLTADLGVGESARCMVRAADAAELPAALVPLRLNCRNRLGDDTYAPRLGSENPHPVNVFHIDPPAAAEIDHHHGRAFRAGRYNIGYFAWELPDFPDAWLPSFDHFDEIWCPSDFTAAAVREKSPLPVLTFPHAIAFAAPPEPPEELRPRFGLPPGKFLALTLFDLNSYAARKNPRGAIAAFRGAGLDPRTAGLVVKVHNFAGNEADFAALEAELRQLPGAILLTATLSRADLYALEAACDCLLSLHRSEGFGLAVAECMHLGKPVISTDWSATAEFVTPANGCPVPARLVTLEATHGPYARGGTWADPDVAAAAAHLRHLAGDPALAARLGAAARTTIAERFAPAVIGARYRRRLEALAMQGLPRG